MLSTGKALLLMRIHGDGWSECLYLCYFDQIKEVVLLLGKNVSRYMHPDQILRVGFCRFLKRVYVYVDPSWSGELNFY